MTQDKDGALPATQDRATRAAPHAPSGHGHPASIPSAAVSEHEGEVVLFRVRAGWERASIFVRPLGDGAEVVAHSSFGTYGYTWVSMGECWRAFLVSCSREYAMRKLAGQSYEVPLGREEFVETMRVELDEYEKGVLDAWGILDPDQERHIASCREALDDEWGWEDVPPEALFWHFNKQANGAPYAMERYEARMTKINPQVVGFWDNIWLPFCDHLASAMSAGTAETPQAVQGRSPASATGEAGDAQTLPETEHD